LSEKTSKEKKNQSSVMSYSIQFLLILGIFEEVGVGRGKKKIKGTLENEVFGFH
jgi:hypothetical protein